MIDFSYGLKGVLLQHRFPELTSMFDPILMATIAPKVL